MSRVSAWRGVRWLRSLPPVGRDAVLYGCSTGFALVTALVVSIPLYRQWGQLAVVPYAVGTLIVTFLWWGRSGRAGSPQVLRAGRIAALLIVLFGATVMPLTLEVVWRSEGQPALHTQPEVVVVERAGSLAATGHDPYRLIDRHGHILIHQDALPVYELYYPYLPGMAVFGLVSGTGVPEALADARIEFLLFTAGVSLAALWWLGTSGDARTRVVQALLVLPSGALPLATGGDDLPVAAMMLLGLVALQRRRPFWAGLALGVASSFKFTAWPLALFALVAAGAVADRAVRARLTYLAGVLVVVVPTVVPFALHNPAAFVDNVVRFPLGLAGVASPAASALPGHEFVAFFPQLHQAYVVALVLMGGAALLWRLVKRPPRTPAQLAWLTGWVMLIAILLAPATRVGYLLYPINLFLWTWLLGRSSSPATSGGGPGSSTGPAQFWSGSWKSSSENGVSPDDRVGLVTRPTSQ